MIFTIYAELRLFCSSQSTTILLTTSLNANSGNVIAKWDESRKSGQFGQHIRQKEFYSKRHQQVFDILDMVWTVAWIHIRLHSYIYIYIYRYTSVRASKPSKSPKHVQPALINFYCM